MIGPEDYTEMGAFIKAVQDIADADDLSGIAQVELLVNVEREFDRRMFGAVTETRDETRARVRELLQRVRAENSGHHG